MVEELKGSPKVEALPHAQVAETARKAYGALVSWHKSVDAWKPPTSISSKREKFDKLCSDFDSAYESLCTYSHAVGALKAKGDFVVARDAAKEKKAKDGQRWRMYGKLERDGVPKFLAKVLFSKKNPFF